MSTKLRALIVEDSEDDTLLLIRALNRQGFELEWQRVETPEAMSAALKESWDVILSDYEMPRFSGPHALQRVREAGLDLPFIIVSGAIGEETAVTAMKLGAHDYLKKDNLHRLGEAIRREIREANNRKKRWLAEERNKHLNCVLRAIRNVNKLIVHEKDPEQLFQKTCRNLVDTRGYSTAWIIALDCSQNCTLTAEAGFGAAFEKMEAQLKANQLPKCGKKALADKGIVIITDPQTTCADCSLLPAISSYGSLTVRLEHEGILYGLMSVNLSEPYLKNDEETSLFQEIAGDIAFALRHIEIEEHRKKSDELIRLSEERFRRFFNNAPEYCYMISTDGFILDINKSALKQLGYKRNDLVGKPFSTVYTPESYRKILPLTSEWKQTKQLRDEELSIITKDGNKRTVLLSTSCVTDPNGGIIHSIAVQRDITERKQIQAQIAQSDRLSSMGMLAAGIAHEINNPLSYVLYNLESLSEDIPKLLGQLREYKCAAERSYGTEWTNELFDNRMEKINHPSFDDIQDRFSDALEGTQKIWEIARGLGAFSRVEEDQLASVNPIHVVEVAINMAFNEIKYRARLFREYGKVSTVMASEGRLSQVFLNLLINSAHSIDEGNVENNQIGVRTWMNNDEVCIEVRDSGKGIKSSNMDKLFEPFFTTKEDGVGTGLGLYISRNIIESYGGRIKVKSIFGKGTHVTVYLPVRRDNQETKQSVSEKVAEVPDIHGRILVVDDEEGIRTAIARILQAHEVVEAKSGEEAKRILEVDQTFDLILCDMMMPRVSGVDLHKWLVQFNPKLAKQVIFITGGAFTPRAWDYLNKVDNLRLEKPFDIRSFIALTKKRILASRRDLE